MHSPANSRFVQRTQRGTDVTSPANASSHRHRGQNQAHHPSPSYACRLVSSRMTASTRMRAFSPLPLRSRLATSRREFFSCEGHMVHRIAGGPGLNNACHEACHSGAGAHASISSRGLKPCGTRMGGLAHLDGALVAHQADAASTQLALRLAASHNGTQAVLRLT